MRPEAEGGSLDEVLNARAPSFLCSAPEDSLVTAEELSIKFDAKEDAEIVQADAAARERRRQGEVPRSLPVMDFLVVPLPENVFADFTPTIVVSNGGDDCDGDDFETDDVCYSVREVCISFGVVAWSANMGVQMRFSSAPWKWVVGSPRHPALPCFGVLSSRVPTSCHATSHTWMSESWIIGRGCEMYAGPVSGIRTRVSTSSWKQMQNVIIFFSQSTI